LKIIYGWNCEKTSFLVVCTKFEFRREIDVRFSCKEKCG